MKTFEYQRMNAVDDVLAALGDPGTRLLAGGTELVNWLKEGIEAPDRVVDITGVADPGLRGISFDDDRLRLGALEKMADVAADPRVRTRFPVLEQSLLRAASAQLRNMATLGGNLEQRTRCPYFRADRQAQPLPCNKRVPGSGCAARHGNTGGQAIFGWSDACVATHPSDLAVALAALDADVLVRSAGAARRIAVTEFHRLPGDDPSRHTELRADELITAIEIPVPEARASAYLKVRERVSYEFAVVSAAAVLRLDGTVITGATLALGGVAHRPWRLRAAEEALRGKDIGDARGLRAAVAESFGEAKALPDNEYKIVLGQRTAVRAIELAAA